MNLEDEIAQTIANSHFCMKVGYLPTEPWEMPDPSSGDMQIACDLLPLVKRAQAEAWDAGFTRGFYAGQAYPDGADASEPPSRNPHVENEGAGAHD